MCESSLSPQGSQQNFIEGNFKLVCIKKKTFCRKSIRQILLCIDGMTASYCFQEYCFWKFNKLGLVYTMDHEIEPWKMAFFHGPTFVIRFLKTNHEIEPWKMAFFHGPTFVIRFLKTTIYKTFGPLTKCKPNVDQEEWPCWIFKYMPKMLVLKRIKFDHSLVFPCLHLLFPQNHFIKKIHNIIICHGPLPFSIGAPILPLTS